MNKEANRIYDEIRQNGGLYIREGMDSGCEWFEDLSVEKRRVLGSSSPNAKRLDEWAEDLYLSTDEIIEYLKQAQLVKDRKSQTELAEELDAQLRAYYGVFDEEEEPEEEILVFEEEEPVTTEEEPVTIPLWRKAWAYIVGLIRPTYARKQLIKKFKGNFDWDIPPIVKHLWYSPYKHIPIGILAILLISIGLNIAQLMPPRVQSPLFLSDFPDAILGGPALGRTVTVKVPVVSIDTWQSEPGAKKLVFINTESPKFGRSPRFTMVSLYRSDKWVNYLRDRLVGNTVTVKGQLFSYRGIPEIKLEAPEQILAVEETKTKDMEPGVEKTIKQLQELSKED